MSRLASTFAKLQAQGKKALVPYLTAGFPTQSDTLPLMRALVEAGADVIELGMPFSDPVADGPVIQKANERALAGGTTTRWILDTVTRFRALDKDTPVVLMGYANPIERYDQRRGQPGTFVQDAAFAGVDGLLVVDYPHWECQKLAPQLRAKGIDLILLLAPTSTPERMAQVAELASGYVYCVALKGVTGAASLHLGEVEEMLSAVRKKIKIPLGVGFGIANAQDACAVAQVADAVIIGSKIIRLVDEAADTALAVEAVSRFVRELRQALDAPHKETPCPG